MVVGKEILVCILHPSCDMCIYDITLWKCPFYKFYIFINLIINKHNLLHKHPFCEILAPKSLISTFQGFNKTPHLSLALLKYEKKIYMAFSILALQLPIHDVEKKITFPINRLFNMSPYLWFMDYYHVYCLISKFHYFLKSWHLLMKFINLFLQVVYLV